MSELLSIIQEFNANNPSLVTWGVAIIIVILGMLSQAFWIKECFCEYKLNRRLKNVGSVSLHNITMADSIDGKIFIENLILLPDKILLLGVKKFRGLIFAAEKIDLWTQVVGNKSYKFENPLRQLESVVLILNSKIKNTKIEEKVLFINGSEFPKGKPEKIVSLDELAKIKCRYAYENISSALREDWEILNGMIIERDYNKNKAVFVDEENISGLNVFSLLVFTTILASWLVWRLV